MRRHDPLWMITINFATHTHWHITHLTEQFVLVLFMGRTIPKIQNRIIFNYLSLMFWRYLVFVMFIVAFLAEVHLLCETIHVAFLVLAFLTLDYTLLLVLLLFELELDQVIWQGLDFLVYLETMTINLWVLILLLKYHGVKSFGRTIVFRLSLFRRNGRIALSRTYFDHKKLMNLFCTIQMRIFKALYLANDKLIATFL